jgi:hypothetical protein
LNNSLAIIICCFVLHNIAIQCREELEEDGELYEGVADDDGEFEYGVNGENREGDEYRNAFVLKYFS